MYRKYLLPILIIAFVSLACSLTINLPDLQNKTGPTQTDTINVPLPENPQAAANVTINFGIGDLNEFAYLRYPEYHGMSNPTQGICTYTHPENG